MEDVEHSMPKAERRSWKRLLIAVAGGLLLAAAALVAIGLWVHSAWMPSYGGKTAEEWLGQVFTTNQPQAMEAFRKMRPDTLPFVMRELQSRETRWDRYYFRKYPTLPAWLKKRLPQPILKSVVWERSRLVLMSEPDARKMLPELARILEGRNVQIRPQIAGIIYNLAGPGDEGIAPALGRCLKDSDPDVRWTVAQTLGRIGPGAKAAIPELAAALNDPSPTVRMQVAAALWTIDRQTNACAQAMREGLKSQPAGIMKSWGVISLSEMTPDDISLIPELVAILQSPDDSYRERAAEALGRYGPAAKEAEPVLILRAQDGYPDLRKAALKALKSIDPAAAAQYKNK